MNIAPFYVGQRVIAVDAVEGSAIKNGKKYIISHCHYAECKRKFYWYVGVEGFDNKWLRPTIFAQMQENKISLMSFKEIVKLEEKEVLIDN